LVNDQQVAIRVLDDNLASREVFVAPGGIIVDRLDSLEAFLAVAQTNGFAAAARQLRISPSAVTRAIAQLELRLGARLFTRTTRSVRLTEAGRLLLEGGRQVVEDLNRVEQQVRGEHAEPRGFLKVSAPTLFGRMHVLPVVAQLLRRYPALSIRLSLSDRMVRLVDEGFDVAVRIGELPDSGLVATRLGSVGYVFVGSPTYFRARGTPADLSAHDVIAFESLQATSEWQFDGSPTVSLRLEPRLSVDSADAAIAAAASGLGVTRVLSYQAREHIADGRLQTVLDPFAAALPVQIVRPDGRLLSANVGAFIKAAAETIPPRLYSPDGHHNKGVRRRNRVSAR
jgi:DNA-binding transcriptional LysR family regulator